MGRRTHTVPPRPDHHRVTQAFVAAHLDVTTRSARDMTSDGRLTAHWMNQRFVRFDLDEVEVEVDMPSHGSAGRLPARPPRPARRRQRRSGVGMMSNPTVSQQDRDVMDDVGLLDNENPAPPGGSLRAPHPGPRHERGESRRSHQALAEVAPERRPRHGWKLAGIGLEIGCAATAILRYRPLMRVHVAC